MRCCKFGFAEGWYTVPGIMTSVLPSSRSFPGTEAGFGRGPFRQEDFIRVFSKVAMECGILEVPCSESNADILLLIRMPAGNRRPNAA